ncbi:aldehyde dehydrogenase family protein [Arthrobacter bambusae]|uniref:aldehyde dehydrogenase family protein n=1 Tax=Arthrobacter bambusae TaxID=1338426 RepID=UPI002788F47C|nr:aldehyde dehydrogenase family protein [Arthrobacter bambusae]MDQ0030726.1 acyl-CoA reductase-like NAD-dependent aldehyde dehydrogenase [Arthrobacter bambusae]MDQ0098987.1 acyl-CoA reductase-like NAD-dependent aldehyde dehydrogenase [Arthrobacter bambusae]
MSSSTLCAQETVVPKFREVTSPYDGRIVGAVPLSDVSSVEAVLEVARSGARKAQALSRNARGKILDAAATAIEHRNEEFAQTIVAESGKTIRQARKEVLRAVNTLRLSAVEARRNAGEVIPFDSYEGSEDRTGWYSREPLGIIAAITPFNDPLNLVAHKIGPAIAGGNAVVLQPSALTPLSAQLLADALVDAGLPQDVLTVVHGDREVAETIIRSRDVRMVSFTGGFSTGESIARAAGLKKLSMDLGGNAPVIIMSDADIDDAVDSCVSGAFWAAGQNCVGVQRILVATSLYADFRRRFLEATARLVAGDPWDEGTDVGPMISSAALLELQAKLDEAIQDGATVLAGNMAEGNVLRPTVLETVPADSRLWKEEVFGPVAMLHAFNTFEDAIEVANAIEFSLHAGIFTDSLGSAMQAAKRLDAGGVMINDSSDYRFDGMPFGGSKYGSMGREGVHFAYEEMTQPKVVCIRNAKP